MHATAAQALLARSFRVSRERGHPILSTPAPHVLATVHPSALLRARDAEREAEIARFKPTSPRWRRSSAETS